ncbi:uncharacterized protein [Rutidosis leptorrhynchoides]|uniref:uncharacterized protein n=1 Tax=Rutidosis leptorrhynchoides TaxID=125765 RepID=UPI003A992856
MKDYISKVDEFADLARELSSNAWYNNIIQFSHTAYDGEIDFRRSHGYLRSCPSSSGAGRFIGSRSGNRLVKPVRIRAGSWNVGTLTGKRYELVETLRKRKVDILCVQETRWKGRGAVKIKDYKLWFSGSRVARNGVGIIIGPPYNENVVDVSRRSDRIMSVRLVIQEGYPGAHGGFGYGVRNEEGLSILDFAVAHDLVVANSFFKKTNAQLATFHNGGHSTQIDYLLLRKGDLRTCGDSKRRVTKSVRPGQLKILWKKLNGEKAETFKTLVVERVDAEVDMVSHDDADQMWNCLAHIIREAAKEALGVAVGTSGGHRSDRESWWLSDEVQSKVALKQIRFREFITCREGTPAGRTMSEERYKEAKREAKKAEARAKEKAYEDLYRKLDSKEGENDIYRIAKARERRRRDLDNIKFIKNEAGQTLVKEDEIRKRWEGYFSSLFAGGRPEGHEDPQDSDIEQSQNIDCGRINQEEVRSALRKMGRSKAVGPDQIPIEAWRCLGDDGVRWLACLFNETYRSSKCLWNG